MTHQIRPIDGNDLLKDVNCRINDLFAAGEDAKLLQCLDEETRRIKSAPTLDYAPVVHAHWDYYSGGIIRPHFRCSACSSPRYEHYAVNEFKYCPSCGARMDEEAR